MTQATPAQRIELIIRRYVEACNKADAEAIAACFRSDAVHYSPYTPKMSGAATIVAISPRWFRNLGAAGRSISYSLIRIDVPQCWSGRASTENGDGSSEE